MTEKSLARAFLVFKILTMPSPQSGEMFISVSSIKVRQLLSERKVHL
jgi:hypothetical protein